MDSRRMPRAAVLVAAAGILAATLTRGGFVNTRPLPPAGSESLQIADLLRNVMLFVPLGAGLAWGRVRPVRSLWIGAGLSALIELAQRAIPGRDASPIDWICNIAGVGLALALFRSAPAWLHPRPAHGRVLTLVAGACAGVALSATGVLLAPAPSAAIFYGHHTPVLGNLAPYGGTVVDASIDGIEIPHGPIPDADRIRTGLDGEYSLRVDVLAGAPPPDLAAFVLISDGEDAIVLLGPDREDLVFHFRSRGDSLGLESARVRLPHALQGVAPGDRIALEVERSARDLCFGIDGSVECGHGFTVGDGWQLLAPDDRILARWRPILDAAWLAALFLPLGYWGRSDAPTAAACAGALIALFLVPAAAGLLPTPLSQVAAAGFGGVLGVASRRHFAAHYAHPQRGA